MKVADLFPWIIKSIQISNKIHAHRHNHFKDDERQHKINSIITQTTLLKVENTYIILKQIIQPDLVEIMSHKNANHDINELLKELNKDIEDEKIYWLRNDAKIRASVTSQSYDEFRDIVAAAHLKPLNKNEMRSKTNIGWNKAMLGNQTEKDE